MEESEGKEEREEAEVVAEGEAEVEAVELLRPLMRAHTPALEALVVPSEDAHQSEYVADADKRREFVSGFSGSAGVAVITGSRALLWTDGRYFLQAQQQLSSAWQLMRGGEEPPLEAWLADHLPRGAGVGVDPWCISVDSAKRWEHAFARRGLKLVPLQRNLVDQVWKARPRPALAPVRTHAVAFAGRPARDKLHDLRQALAKERASAILVTTLDEVAWLYNLRGSDVLYNPVVHAFAIVTAHAAFYYVDRRKIDEVVEHYLLENGVEIRDYDRMLPDVEELGRACAAAADPEPEPADASAEEEVEEEDDHDSSNAPTLVWLDPASCSYALYARLPRDRVLLQQSPLALAKALKHPVELQGMRNSHIRDGAAVVCHTAWLDRQMQEVYGAAGYFSEGNDGKGSLKRKRSDKEKLTEISVSDKLEEFRSKRDLFKGLSFDTISAVGANAAIIHYSAVTHSCAEMQPDAMYLCDSGGQYLDGTTDITRTMHFGKPSAHEKACYTRVLKAHIGLDTAVFPNGTTGHALDILARLPLWKDGLDYRHGTGHGVGSYLNVHEGPHLISFRPQARNVSLQANMTVTDEPGYYEEGNFGIRIENVLIIKEAEVKHNFGEKCYLGFEHITWVPYQQKLMDVSLLTPEEISWIDKYHLDCRKVLAAHLSGDDLDWLVQATNPLSASA